MKKQPEVTAKTRQKLIDAFWNITYEKELDKVTVSSLMKEAGYNRGTFYEYFMDIPDLLEQIENEMVKILLNLIVDKFSNGVPLNLQTLSREWASIFIQFDDKLFYLLSKDPVFFSKFKNEFANTVTHLFDLGEKNQYKEYIITFCYSAIIGIRLYWYESGKKLSFDEIISITQELVATGAFGFIGQDYIK